MTNVFFFFLKIEGSNALRILVAKRIGPTIGIATIPVCASAVAITAVLVTTFWTLFVSKDCLL